MVWRRFEGLPGLASSSWAYPALEVVHIVGIALLLGSLVVVELRVWGAAPSLSLPVLARLALPVSLAGFCLVAGSGLLLFAANPNDMLANRATLIPQLEAEIAALDTQIAATPDGSAYRQAGPNSGSK